MSRDRRAVALRYPCGEVWETSHPRYASRANGFVTTLTVELDEDDDGEIVPVWRVRIVWPTAYGPAPVTSMNTGQRRHMQGTARAVLGDVGVGAERWARERCAFWLTKRLCEEEEGRLPAGWLEASVSELEAVA